MVFLSKDLSDIAIEVAAVCDHYMVASPFLYDPSHKTYPPHPREHEGYTLALTDDLVPGPTQQEVDQCGHITDCYITTLVAISSGVINSATAQQQVDGGIALSRYKFR